MQPNTRNETPCLQYSPASPMLFPKLATPDQAPALLLGEQTITWAQLAQRVAQHQQWLLSHGATPESRIAVEAIPSLDTMVALVAQAALGYVSVPLNPASGSKELAHVLQDAAPKLVLSAQAEALEKRLSGHSVLPLSSITNNSPPLTLPTLSNQPLLLLYTSGTTGLPKGAVLTLQNITSNLIGLQKAWHWTANDRLTHALPFFHVHGLVLGLYGPLSIGGSLRHLGKFTPEAVCQALSTDSTMLFAVPTMYHRLADYGEQHPEGASALAKARLLISGSAALPLREHQRIQKLAQKPLLERYGLTETLINTAQTLDLPATPGTVGFPLEGTQLRLVDDQRNPLPVSEGAIGEVAVRGPNVFAGYLNRPDATAAVLDNDGWFYTGDIATIESDGALRIVGRKATDLIKTGGFKVGAGEVEAALLEHPAVLEAAVIATPDDDLGERIVAFVVLRPQTETTESALTEYVAKLLAPHKRPRQVHFIAELPRNAMGKIVKPNLRALL